MRREREAVMSRIVSPIHEWSKTVGKVTFTKNIGKGPSPEGVTEQRWKIMGRNLRAAERLTGIAVMSADGWETVAVILMAQLREAKKQNAK